MTARDEETRVIGYFVPSTLEMPPTHRVVVRLRHLLVSQRRVIAVAVALLVLASIVYLIIAPRIYRSEAVLIAVSDKDTAQALESITGQFSGLASLVGIDLDTDSAKREALATLRSKSFLISFIRDEQLLPVLFADRWNSEAKQWDLRWWQSTPTEQDAYKKMSRRVFRATDDKTSGVVLIRVDWQDPTTAADWANGLVARANALLQKRAIDEAAKSLAFLDEELAKTTVVELRQAIHRLQESQIRRIMLANVRHEYSFKVIDPAIPADADDYVKPKIVLVLSLAITGGLLIGLLIAAIIDSAQRKRTVQT